MQRKRDGLVPVREALSGLGGFAATVEDFEKLLLARAGVRLMIFDGNYKPGSKGIAKLTAGPLNNHRLKGGGFEFGG